MIVKLRSHTGGALLINPDHVAFGGQAYMKEPPHHPIVGQTVLVMLNGVELQVLGTPEQVYGEIRRVDSRALLVEANGKRADD